jgi:hypothetical protein
LANRDDLSEETKNNLHETLKNLIKNPTSLIPGQCPCGMKVSITNKEDNTSEAIMMHCHLLVDHGGDHEHYGHNKSTWYWKD